MKFVVIFFLCCYGTISIKAGFSRLCEIEKYIYYQILCTLMEGKIVLIDKNGDIVNKEELGSILNIKKYFAHKEVSGGS